MNADLIECYEERAAIMEFEGGLPREKAEALARAELDAHIKARKAADAGAA